MSSDNFGNKYISSFEEKMAKEVKVSVINRTLEHVCKDILDAQVLLFHTRAGN